MNDNGATHAPDEYRRICGLSCGTVEERLLDGSAPASTKSHVPDPCYHTVLIGSALRQVTTRFV
jgi:hypothetical protein